MLRPGMRPNTNVINIGLRKITYGRQHASNSPNKCGAGVESERHADPFVQAVVRDARGQPPVSLRHGYLPVAALGVERRDDLRRSDLGQRLVDRRHGVRIAHCETVQVSTVTGNAHTAGFLGDADDGARHRADRRAYEFHV